MVSTQCSRLPSLTQSSEATVVCLFAHHSLGRSSCVQGLPGSIQPDSSPALQKCDPSLLALLCLSLISEPCPVVVIRQQAGWFSPLSETTSAPLGQSQSTADPQAALF